MNKKGFTLVELLAVIAILAILVVIALPNVIDMFQGAKKGTFKNEVQQLLRQTESTWVLKGGGIQYFCGCAKDTGGFSGFKNAAAHSSQLSMQGTNLNYFIGVNAEGEFTTIQVSDEDYGFNSVQSGITVSAKIDDESIYSSAAKTGSEELGYYTASHAADAARRCCQPAS